MEETREQQQMYNMFRSCIYLILIIEIVMNLPVTTSNSMIAFVLELFHRFKVFDSVATCKVMELICITVTCIGTKARKSLKWNLKTMVLYPVLAGATMIVLCFVFYGMPFNGAFAGSPLNRCLYVLCSVVGTMLIHQGFDAIAQYLGMKIGDDKWDFDNESFEQSRNKEENEFSVNIPMVYYYKKKLNHGWINIINPFRATIVLGTPGSGKSFGIIDPFIRQHSAKGFAMMVYDYKFPALARNLFYQYCKNRKQGTLPKNCGFRIVNFTDVEYSNRVNPIQRKYIPDLAAASETAATLLSSLNKGGGEKKGGSEAFFQNSAENFLAAIIYFFVNFHPTGYKNGMQKIITTCGNIFMGAARNKETWEWAQNDVFGKAKQTSKSITINDSKVSTSISEKMDNLVPAAKIADMATGWLAGQAARDFTPTERSSFSGINLEESPEFKTTKYFCKTNFNMAEIKKEEAQYVDLPKIYAFKNARQKEVMLNRNFARVNREIDEMIKSLLSSQ